MITEEPKEMPTYKQDAPLTTQELLKTAKSFEPGMDQEVKWSSQLQEKQTNVNYIG